jgi:ABC-type bacteriocin/lantibiotic exporter with double-glycine peptidase domain
MENSAHHIHPFARLTSILRLERDTFWVAVIYSAAVGVLSLVMPVATQSLVNTIAFGNLFQPLLILSLLVLVGLTVSALFQAMRFRVVEIIQRRLFVRISSECANRLLQARVDELKARNGPELVNRFLEVVTLQKSASTLLVDGLGVLMQTVIGMILLAIYHPWLLAFDILLLGAILIVVFPMGSGAVSTAVSESKAKYDLVAWLEETARHPTTFRGKPAKEYAWRRTDELVAEYLKHRARHFRILLRQFIGALGLHAIASAALLSVGGWLVINRQLTLGQLIAAELVVAIVVTGFSKLGKHLEIFYDLMAAMDKLGYLTDLPVEDSGEETVSPLPRPAGVRLSNGQWTMEVAAGERVGVRGHSGSGKTTLLDTICGYRPLAGGSVEIDGIDIRQLRLADLRATMALVRGVEIFHGTILDNVRVGREEVGITEISDAMTRAGLARHVSSLPAGLETELATGGPPLSEGQAQALVLARAIAGRPRLLVIDETLDHIQDAAERELLLSTLFDERAPWTLIVASAREDILERCDRVFNVERGAVKEAA